MIEEPLKTVLGRYYHVEVQDPEHMKKWVDAGRTLGLDINLVKQQLRGAIELNSITPEEYEALTGHDFDSQNELLEYLTSCLRQLEGWFP